MTAVETIIALLGIVIVLELARLVVLCRVARDVARIARCVDVYRVRE